jgi:hypothetical protein
MQLLRHILRIAVVTLVVALLAALPASAAPRAADSGALTFAFRGRVDAGPAKGTVIAGDLSLTPAADGTVSGALDLPDGTSVPVSGRLAQGNLSVTFDLGGGVYIFGIGQANEDGEFEGPFVGPGEGNRGEWEATPITKASFNFSGTVRRGPSSGTTIAGLLALSIDGDGDFTGTLTVGDTKIPVKGELDDEGAEIEVRFDLGDGVMIRGEGDRTEDGGYAGSFKGPQSGDRGDWTATPVS